MAESKQPESDVVETQNGVEDRTINKIAILYAMDEEAAPLIQRLKLKESEERSKQMVPFPVYSNEDESLMVVTQGKDPKHKCNKIGTQWAAVAAYLMIHRIAPDIIINAGTCGGVDPKYCFDDQTDGDNVANNESNESNVSNESELQIADVFIGEKAIYSDRRVGIAMFKPWDIGQYQLFGSEYLSQKIKGLKVAKCIATSNAFDYTEEDKAIYKENGVVCKEMECAAIAEQCHSFGIKLIAIKGITDLVAHHDEKNFLQNLAKTMNAVTDMAEAVIKEIMGKKLSDIGSL